METYSIIIKDKIKDFHIKDFEDFMGIYSIAKKIKIMDFHIKDFEDSIKIVKDMVNFNFQVTKINHYQAYINSSFHSCMYLIKSKNIFKIIYFLISPHLLVLYHCILLLYSILSDLLS